MTKERKLTGNIKGIVSKYSDNSFEFRPFGKGEPVYEEKQEFKNAEVHIYVQDDPKDNRLQIKYHR